MRTLLFLSGILFLSAFGDPHYAAMKEGNELFRAGDAAGAAQRYAAAREHRDSPEARYNLGAAMYGQGRYDEAAALFDAAGAGDAAGLKARAGLNRANSQNALGARQLEAGDAAARQTLEKAVAGYREALLRDPANPSAKHNMEVALRRLERARDPEQEGGKGGGEKGRGKNGKDRGKESGNGGDEQGDAAGKDAPDTMKKEQADTILRTLARAEENTRREMRRGKMQEREVEKDW